MHCACIVRALYVHCKTRSLCNSASGGVEAHATLVHQADQFLPTCGASYNVASLWLAAWKTSSTRTRRGGSCLRDIYKTFLICRTCMRRAPAKPVRACILQKLCPVSHVTFEAPLHPSHFSLHSSHSTLHTSHSTLHTSHFTLHTSHFTLHTSHSTLHTSHFTLHTSHFTLHTSLFTVHTSHFSLLSSHSTLHTPHFTLHSSPTLHTAFFTLHTSSHLSSSHLIPAHLFSSHLFSYVI